MSRTYLSQSLEHPRGWPPRPSVSSPKEQLFLRIFPQGFVQSDYHLTKIVIHKGLHKAIRNFRSISFSISEAFHLYFPRHQIPFFRGYAHYANTEGTASKQFPRRDRPASDWRRRTAKLHPLTAEHFPSNSPHRKPATCPTPPRSAVTSPTKHSEFDKEAQ